MTPKELAEKQKEKLRQVEEKLAHIDVLEMVSNQKDQAYAERNQCVALIAKLALKLGWKAGVANHPAEDKDWEDDWRTVLFIELPSGQVSWHFHDSERHLLAELPHYDGSWDGHTTEQKYERVSAL